MDMIKFPTFWLYEDCGFIWSQRDQSKAKLSSGIWILQFELQLLQS